MRACGRRSMRRWPQFSDLRSGPVAIEIKEVTQKVWKTHFIRATRIDELPQLLNIIRGDMSFVGPRPERPEIIREYCEDMPEFNFRTRVKAGLTGFAQVYGKYNTTIYDKLLMDLMYSAKPSILEDLTIMLATVNILTSNESPEGVGEGKDKLELRECK